MDQKNSPATTIGFAGPMTLLCLLPRPKSLSKRLQLFLGWFPEITV